MIDKELIDKMANSIEEETKGMSENVGVSINLWKLKSLIAGYQYAMEHGYGQAK